MSGRGDYIDEAGYVLTATEYGLSGAEFIGDLSLGKIRDAYNGIGPEWMSQKIRDKLTKYLRIFAVPCVIHDCRFAYWNDGTDARFREANDELERNCVIVADANYPWLHLRRYLARRAGRVMAQACRLYGWTAWREAYEKGRQFPAGAGNAGGTLKCHFRLDAPSA